MEITDDVLLDQHEDFLALWWDDDCVEIFVDEDNSKERENFIGLEIVEGERLKQKLD